MKTASTIKHPGNRRDQTRLAIVLLALAASLLPAAPAAAPSEPKPYTLFLGADLEVQQGKAFARVQGVEGDNLLAFVDSKLTSIPTARGPVNLRVQKALKLAHSVVTVANLKSDRTYTPANDPVRKFERQQPGSAGLMQYDLAQGRATRFARNASIGDQGSPDHAKAVAQAQAAQEEAYKSLDQMDQPFNNIDDYTVQMQTELARKLFDAIEITFEVSAPAPVPDPYIVVVAQYHDPAEAKGTAHNWIYAKTLDPIDQKPRTVTIKKGGFPKGFELEGFQVHLYERGQELATSVAERQMALTRDQAFQYVVVEHLASHKGANVPATPGLAQLPPDLRSRLSGGQLGRTYYVKVNKDGLPLDAYVDPSCLQKVDDSYLQGVITDIRFKPALEKGQPVEGVALLKLSDLR